MNKDDIKITNPITGETGFIPGGGASEMQKILDARYAYTLEYMREKGWGDSIEALSIAQILEINEQEEWKNPLKEDRD